MTNTTEKHVKDLNETWNTKNAEKVSEHFAEDASFQDPFTPQPVQGRAAVKGYLTGLFTAFPDFSLKLGNTIIQGDTAVALNTATGTFKGEMHGQDGKKIAPTNKKFTHEAAVYFEFDTHGKIKKARVYGDTLSLVQQLGIPPQ